MAIEVSRPLIEARKHVLKVSLPQQAVEVEGDAGRLAQVVSNLLNNSAKYSDDGGRIELTVEVTGDRGRAARERHRHRDRTGHVAENLRSVCPGERFDEPLRRRGWGSDWPWCAT